MGSLHAQKNAIKTAIAFVLACGIAIAFNWEHPIWAGFSVFFPRMPYAGMTLQKSKLYSFGSILAVVALTLIMAWSAGSPWDALILLSVWFAACNLAARRLGMNYAFLIASTISLIVFVNIVFRPSDFYEVVYYRTAETLLGVIVGTLINALIWPELELPVIGATFESIRTECIDFMRTLAARIEGDEHASVELDHQAERIGSQFTNLVALFVSAHRNTLSPSSLVAPSLLYFDSRTLVRRLFALRVLVRNYVLASRSESGPWFVAWLNAEADRLEAMDWRQRKVTEGYRSNDESNDIRGEIQNYVNAMLPQVDDHFQAITSCVAARDLLLDVSEAVETIAGSLEASEEDLGQRLAARGEVVGAALPKESWRFDVWKATTALVSVLAGGAVWYASQNPATASTLVVAGLSNVIYAMTRCFVATICAAGLLIGIAVALITFLVVMPQLDGVAQLSVALFVPAYVIALIREHPKYSMVGVWAFLAFCVLVILQDQQPSFIITSQNMFDSALAQCLGAAIAGVVILSLNSSTPRDRFELQVTRVLAAALLVLDINRHRTPHGYERSRLSNDLRNTILACDEASFWEQLAAQRHPDDAVPMQRLVQSLRATAFSFTRLAVLRATHLDSLPVPVLQAEQSLHASLNSYIEFLTSDQAIEAQTVWAELRTRLDETSRVTLAEIHDAPLEMKHTMLSLIGHYFAVETTLERSAHAAIQLRQNTTVNTQLPHVGDLVVGATR